MTALHTHGRRSDWNAPFGWAPDPQLRRWLHWQRSVKKSGQIKRERARHIEKLGFDWQLRDQHDLWDVHYAELVEFHRQHGHCRVLYSGRNKALAAWAKRQRVRRESMDADRRALLEALGFEWASAALEIPQAA